MRKRIDPKKHVFTLLVNSSDNALYRQNIEAPPLWAARQNVVLSGGRRIAHLDDINFRLSQFMVLWLPETRRRIPKILEGKFNRSSRIWRVLRGVGECLAILGRCCRMWVGWGGRCSRVSSKATRKMKCHVQEGRMRFPMKLMSGLWARAENTGKETRGMAKLANGQMRLEM